MTDIFISYARSDQKKVQLIAERIAALGYTVWWDRDLPPHKSYGDVISEKIGEARAVIVIWSDSAAASQWVRAEADTAREQHKLVQAALDDTRPPMPFNMLQVVSLADWEGEDDHHGWAKIKESLAELCSVTSDSANPIMPAAPVSAPVTAATPPRNYTGLIIALAAIAGVTIVAVTANLSRSSDGDPEAAVESVEDSFPRQATIEDPQGFAYIRNAPSGSAAIVGRILNGENFYTREQIADWWEVRTEDGVQGFVRESAISRDGGETGNALTTEDPDPAISSEAE